MIELMVGALLGMLGFAFGAYFGISIKDASRRMDDYGASGWTIGTLKDHLDKKQSKKSKVKK